MDGEGGLRLKPVTKTRRNTLGTHYQGGLRLKPMTKTVMDKHKKNLKQKLRSGKEAFC